MPAGKQSGFTLLAVLVALVLLALGVNQVTTVVSQQAQREREAQLLQIGLAYQQAIGNFYESTPGTVKRWPRDVSDLLEDKRFVTLRRHLRKAYVDPVATGADWGFIRASDGGIQGVYSQSELAPIRSAALELSGLSLPAASQYRQWEFVYVPNTVKR
ncbi:MAG: prepilin-type N-terminal cleavage/methylation domain-containing protein [Burkholderiaceae bacterium]